MADLFPYTASPEGDSSAEPNWDTHEESSSWMRQIPLGQPLEIEGILNTQVVKQTRRKEYLQYLIKWKNHPIEDSSWLDASQIQHAGYSIKELMDQSHEFSSTSGA